jgi:hypothetical protein
MLQCRIENVIDAHSMCETMAADATIPSKTSVARLEKCGSRRYFLKYGIGGKNHERLTFVHPLPCVQVIMPERRQMP